MSKEDKWNKEVDEMLKKRKLVAYSPCPHCGKDVYVVEMPTKILSKKLGKAFQFLTSKKFHEKFEWIAGQEESGDE